MKNVLLIDLGSEYGGAEKVVEKIFCNITEGYNNYIVCLENSRFYNNLINNKRIDNKKIIVLSNKKNFIKNIVRVVGLINEYNVDIIHTHGILSNFIALIPSIIKNTPIIYTIHSKADCDRGMTFRGLILKKLETILCKAVNLNIAVSKDIYINMMERKVNEKKLVVIRNGIEDELINDRINLFDNKFITLVNIARITNVKAQYLIIESIKLLRQEGIIVNCVFVGDGDDLDKLKALSYKYELESNVKFLGFREDIDEILNSCDIFILSSLMEGLPISVLEAMRSQKIIIAPNIGGIPEVLNHSNSYLFECGNVNSISESIKRVISEIPEAECKALRARADFINNYSIDRFKNDTVKVYENAK